MKRLRMQSLIIWLGVIWTAASIGLASAQTESPSPQNSPIVSAVVSQIINQLFPGSPSPQNSPSVSAPPKVVSRPPRTVSGTDDWQRRQPERQSEVGLELAVDEPEVAPVTTTAPARRWSRRSHAETTAPEPRSWSSLKPAAAAAIVAELPKTPRTVQERPAATAASPAPSKDRTDKVALFAQEKQTKSAGKGQTGALKTGVSMVFKLALVLVLAYLTVLALKLLSARKDGQTRSGHDLKTLDTVKLSQTSSLHVVNFNGKQMLIGCSAGQVNLLREFDETEMAEQEPAEQGRFAEYLAKYSGNSFQKSPAGRVAGLLRDCASHLKGQDVRRNPGDTNEA